MPAARVGSVPAVPGMAGNSWSSWDHRLAPHSSQPRLLQALASTALRALRRNLAQHKLRSELGLAFSGVVATVHALSEGF